MPSVNITGRFHARRTGLFDSKIMRNLEMHYPWYWEETWYWWLYADEMSDHEWDISNGELRYRGVGETEWRHAIWAGSENGRPQWMAVQSSDPYKTCQVAFVNGRLIETVWAPHMDNLRSVMFPINRAAREKIVQGARKHTAEGVKHMPDFTPEQIEELYVKINARYLRACELYESSGSWVYREQMTVHERRLEEIGKVPDVFKFAPVEVTIYRLPTGAFFVEDPGDQHDPEDEDCECPHCLHDPAEFLKDICSCMGCSANFSHWSSHNRNPDHCNFCKEYAEYLEAVKARAREGENK